MVVTTAMTVAMMAMATMPAQSAGAAAAQRLQLRAVVDEAVQFHQIAEQNYSLNLPSSGCLFS